MAQDQLAASHRLGRNVLGRNVLGRNVLGRNVLGRDVLDARPVAVGLAFLAPEQTPRLGDRKRLGDMEAVLVKRCL